jgi:PAS domain S-box-containing protein
VKARGAKPLSVSIKRRRLSVLLLVLGLAGALLGLENLAARKVLFDSFGQLEREEGDRSLQQVLKALEADLNQLAISNHDYAAWDDAYEFVQSRDPHFLESNFATETIANLNVDVVWMIDTQNRDIVSYERTPAVEAGLPPTASEEVLTLLRSQLPGLWKHADTSSFTRLLQTSHGLLAFAAHPIVATGGRGEPRALLVFARFIDNAVLKRVHDTSQLPVALYTSSSERGALPQQAQSLWNSTAHDPGRLLLKSNEQTLGGYALIRDVAGAPAAIVSTHIERKLFAFGHQTLRYLMVLFATVVALFATLLGALLLYLEKILHAHAASERRYRAVISEAQETMLLVDAGSRRILEANPAASTTLGYKGDELVEMQIDDLFYACDGDVLKSVQPELHAATRADRILIVRCKNKDFIDVEVTASPLLIDQRETISFVLRDVSARKKAERQLVHNQDRLSHLAHHDALTGLLNRLGL